jgi:hypothetical protein
VTNKTDLKYPFKKANLKKESTLDCGIKILNMLFLDQREDVSVTFEI